MTRSQAMICPKGHVFDVDVHAWRIHASHPCTICGERTFQSYFGPDRKVRTKEEAVAVGGGLRWESMWLERQIESVRKRAFA